VLRFLLDEHLNPAIAEAVRTQIPEVETAQLARWENGSYRGSPDEALLTAARALGWTLVTFDQRTIVPLLRLWAQREIAHGGVIFMSTSTYRPTDVGGIAGALVRLWRTYGADDWTDRAVYLQAD
jgi:Domain of unknown function (DUF5615)